MSDTDLEVRERSPRSPFVTLRRALDRAKELFDEHDRHAVRVESATSAWGYGAKSSGGRQTLATLIMYGILQDSGSGTDRKVQLTDAAFRYLVDEREEQRAAVIKQLALAPKIMNELWGAWGAKPPGDAECRSQLRIERGFTEAAAQDLLAIYKDNIAFAKLGPSDILPSAPPVVDPAKKENPMVHQPQHQILQPPPVITPAENLGENDIKVMLDGDRIRVSAFVDAKGAKRLMKALKANIALLDDEDDDDQEAAN
jgi:hypothetical protein